ncbi:ribonuclease P protein subunit p40-like [Panonychus citri]|uniref:ribonuclease P protein subunit p40-like n=1 Tax=Panonychus citri TaxID=50023 RepID=UPI0023082AE4|nr:ribonuclease P protein subunit p40-like [Panonychus citri]
MSWPKFPSVKSSLLIDTSVPLANLMDYSNLNKTIMNHPFNQTIQIMIPNNPSKPKDPSERVGPRMESRLYPTLGKIFSGFGVGTKDDPYNYFIVKSIPLHLLIHPVLIEYYVKKGSLYAMSIDTQVHLDDCVALSSKTLTLSVTEQTYRRLGLTGTKSIMVRNKKVKQKYIINIKLSYGQDIEVEKRVYQSTFRKLRNSNLKFDLIMKWEPNPALTKNPSPASLLKFFEHLKCTPGHRGGYLLCQLEVSQIHLHLCHPSIKIFDRSNLQAPKDLIGDECLPDEHRAVGEDAVEQEDINMEEKKSTTSKQSTKIEKQDPADCPFLDTIDWIGSIFSGVEMTASLVDPEVTSFYLNESDTSLLKQLLCIQMSGFFSPNDVQTLIKELAKLVETNDPKEVPFTSIIVNGFDHCCISWNETCNEHGAKTNGENLYGIVLRKCDNNSIWRIAEEYDFGIEKL